MIYIYDGSYDGVMSALFAAFKDSAAEIVRDRQMIGVSLFETRIVETSEERSHRLQAGLERLGGNTGPRFYKAWLSEAPGVEDLMLAAARVGFSLGRDPFALRQNSAVRKLSAWADKVGHEQERMLQFVRFTKLAPLAYGADIEPMYDVLPLIGGHFHFRYPDSRLIIRDLARRKAIVSEPKGWQILPLTREEAERPLPADGGFETLWRGYFQAVAIEGRRNLKLQQKNVPLRYRDHMTEFRDPEPERRFGLPGERT